MDIRQILCPVDFSDASAHAVAQAAALARWYGARITALHVDTAGRPASTHSRMQKSQHARWTRPSNSACRIAWPCSAWPQQPRASRSCPVLTVPPPAHNRRHVEAASRRDLEAAPLAYVTLTMRCVQCHRYAARARIANAGQ